MAYFAQLNDENIVTQVISVSNEDLLDNGIESEAKGIAFCQSLLGGNWKQTSYNNRIRKNYAGIGYTYDSQRDAFIPPKPFASWVLNEDTCLWNAPTPMPTDNKYYQWDENTLTWVEFINTPAEENQ
jgi:hypothetical protein